MLVAALLTWAVNLTGQSSIAGTSLWPHEPAGLATISDFGFSTRSDSGWINEYAADLTSGRLTITSDATAPVSPPLVAQFYYQKGNTSLCGAAPGTLTLVYPPKSVLYIGTWAKLSAGFSFPGGTPDGEVHFLYGNPQTPAWAVVDLRQDGGVEFIGAGFDKWSKAGLYTVGQWTHVELLMDYVAKTAQVWINGAPAFPSPTPTTYTGGSFTRVQVSPTWGGCHGSVPENDSWLWYDHIRVSGK